MNLNYNKLRLVTFLVGFIVIIFSETTIRFISKISVYDVSMMLIPVILLIFLYLFLFKKFNIFLKN